jgi:hypothetical protein
MTKPTPGKHPACIGGNLCVCYRHVEHAHCVCNDPHCACHSAAAYRLAKTVLRDGSEVYGRASAPVDVQTLEVAL